MKFNTFLIAGLLTASAVLLYEKKDRVIAQLSETKNSIDGIQTSLANIKKNIDIIQSQQHILKNLNQELSYKGHVFNNEIRAHINEIKNISAKYQTTDK
ncbi:MULTISPECIES: chemotaxis protein [Streptococcus]|uniref:Chemotaxis protein n=1 Tax=Streptococcus caledonicus TaxID=2614158 RepID=A0ABW0UE26_9STRE|nr:chemotaxis protein [Streptococcus sp. S784/96/1]